MRTSRSARTKGVCTCRATAAARVSARPQSCVLGHHGEAVTPEAGHGDGVGDEAGQAGRQLLQQAVADLVAEAVVEHLEAVEVGVQHGDRAAAQRFLQSVEQVDPVAETGEVIVGGVPRQSPLGPHAVGDLGDRHDGPAAGRGQRCDLHRVPRLARPGRAPVGDALPRGRLAGQHPLDAVGQLAGRPQHRSGGEGGAQPGDEVAALGQGAAVQIGPLALAPDPVGDDEAAVPVDDRGAGRDGIEQSPSERPDGHAQRVGRFGANGRPGGGDGAAGCRRHDGTRTAGATGRAGRGAVTVAPAAAGGAPPPRHPPGPPWPGCRSDQR